MHCLLHCLDDKQLTGFAAGFNKWQPDGAAADATLIVFKRTFLQEKLEVFILEILFVAHLFIPLSAVRLRGECVLCVFVPGHHLAIFYRF